MSSAEGVHCSTVWRILHKDWLYPYHLQRVQGLKPEDLPRLVKFCQWCLKQCVQHPQFLWKLLFTDEAMFTWDGIFNFHNVHIWAHVSPHAIQEARHQTTFSINVWAGIIGDLLFGPVCLPERLMWPTYQEVLERLTRDILPYVLDDVPLQLQVGMWFMHDGAPPHFNRIAHQYLNDHFPGRWVRRNGPVAWPAHSLDLNPIDFYLWGHVNLSLLHTPHQRWRVMGTHRSHIWCHQEPTRSTGTYQGICDGQHFEHLMWYPKGYQHMNISQYLWTCSLLDPCW